MKIYLCGGAVRDKLLGLIPKDHDYVVVGSSPEELLALGYERVGISFPVFLKDGCEYALARTERKTGVGYNGFTVEFDPTVTLKDDLIRRDLSINSMAMDLDTGEIIDPFSGQADLTAGILRATSAAYSDDPVRILRTARFVARYGFTVEPNTLELMRAGVPELQFVNKERIWAEIEKGLMEDYPHKMFQVLSDCAALDCMGPLAPFSQAAYSHVLERLSNVTQQHSLAVRFALIANGFHGTDYEDFRVPSHIARVAKTFSHHLKAFMNYSSTSAQDRILLLDRIRAFSNPVLLNECLQALTFFHQYDGTLETIDIIRTDLARAGRINAAAIAAAQSNLKSIQGAIQQARVDAIS